MLPVANWLKWIGSRATIDFFEIPGSADAVNVFVEAESVSCATGKRACVTSVLVGLGIFFESRLAKNRCRISIVTYRVAAGCLTYAGCLPLRRNDIVNRTKENIDYYNIRGIYVFLKATSPQKCEF